MGEIAASEAVESHNVCRKCSVTSSFNAFKRVSLYGFLNRSGIEEAPIMHQQTPSNTVYRGSLWWLSRAISRYDCRLIYRAVRGTGARPP